MHIEHFFKKILIRKHVGSYLFLNIEIMIY
jgi:hypothetical protein